MKTKPPAPPPPSAERDVKADLANRLWGKRLADCTPWEESLVEMAGKMLTHAVVAIGDPGLDGRVLISRAQALGPGGAAKQTAEVLDQKTAVLRRFSEALDLILDLAEAPNVALRRENDEVLRRDAAASVLPMPRRRA